MHDDDEKVVKDFINRHAPRHGRGPWDDRSDITALLAVLQYLEPMISNGGWPAVYYNRVGWCVPLAARAYRTLGMSGCAARCERAIQLVGEAERSHPGLDHATEEWLSRTLMEAVGEAGWDELDNGWFDLVTDTWKHAARHIHEHGL